MDIVNNLVSNKVIELIDPTLMLNSEEWLQISQRPLGLDKSDRYVLKYFLGEENEEISDYIKNVAQKENMKIHSILSREDLCLYSSDPAEFLYSIANASIVFTDSFHACAFSIIFNKPFYVFDRKSEYADMSSRISSLLHKFNLKNHHGNINNYNLMEFSYESAYKILNKEKNSIII